jgi:uncharacterized protein
MTGPTSDTEVPAFWQALGLPGLADIQVKFLPPRMQRRARAAANEYARPTVRPAGGGAVQVSARPSTIYRWSDDERVHHLHTMGIRAFTALAYAEESGVAADLNAWTLDFAARTPDCIPSATLFPELGVNRYVRTALDNGARIFNARCDVTHALLDAVWGLLADAGIPVIVPSRSTKDATVHTGLEAVTTLLRRHPRLTAVIAHFGAPDYVDFLELAENYERVCLDTSLGFTRALEDHAPYPRAQLGRLRGLGLAGKVMLGSDFPDLPYPYASQLSALAELDLGDDWLRAVCWDNAATLLRLS